MLMDSSATNLDLLLERERAHVCGDWNANLHGDATAERHEAIDERLVLPLGRSSGTLHRHDITRTVIATCTYTVSSQSSFSRTL